jgi:hypothetical protein
LKSGGKIQFSQQRILLLMVKRNAPQNVAWYGHGSNYIFTASHHTPASGYKVENQDHYCDNQQKMDQAAADV